jgi:hypothetical protein
VEAFLGNLQTRIFHHNSSVETNQWALGLGNISGLLLLLFLLAVAAILWGFGMAIVVRYRYTFVFSLLGLLVCYWIYASVR